MESATNEKASYGYYITWAMIYAATGSMLVDGIKSEGALLMIGVYLIGLVGLFLWRSDWWYRLVVAGILWLVFILTFSTYTNLLRPRIPPEGGVEDGHPIPGYVAMYEQCAVGLALLSVLFCGWQLRASKAPVWHRRITLGIWIVLLAGIILCFGR